MYDKIIVKFNERQFGYKAKMDVLTNGVCRGILPISIIKKDGDITGVYVTSGYKRLSELKKLSADEILTVVEKTVDAMEECNNYLIFSDEFVLSLDTVYIKDDFEKIKFTYIPDNNRSGATKKLIYFINQLKLITTENGATYLDMLKQIFATENLSMLKIKAVIAQLKREINLCKIT